MTSNHDEPIVFIGSFPPIMSALKVTGNDDGMRIQIDIPEDQMGNAARLLLMRKRAFKVTIEAIPPPTNTTKKRY